MLSDKSRLRKATSLAATGYPLPRLAGNRPASIALGPFAMRAEELLRQCGAELR
jgi:hypothetical protein